MSVAVLEAVVSPAKRKTVKCVVWDLDNTLWDGVLLEDGPVPLRDGAREVIRALDERGILQSIASRNEPAVALARLEELGIAEFFLDPQIGWQSKALSVDAIAKAIDIGIDTLAFVDDQPFERDEVAQSHPEVLCLEPTDLRRLLHLPELTPTLITEDSRRRRAMYLADRQRTAVEESFTGPSEAFLATLDMRLTVLPAGMTDLARAEELTVRTNQLNTTGYTYSHEDLRAFSRSPDHLLLMAELDDTYGTYGKIGLVLVEKGAGAWTIKLLLMSCRVMSRGIGGVLINLVRDRAREAGVRLLAEFVPNGRNRMMYVTYKFNHFRDIAKDGERVLLENDLSKIQIYPDYLTLILV
jgi:FkbH-like protein